MDLRWVVRLYPRAWRDRYEDEMLAHLEQRPASVVTLVDLVLGALDAHLDPAQLANGATPGARLMLQLRASSRLAFWSFPLFVFLYFVLIVDEVDIAWDALRDTTPLAALASWTTAIGALVATFTILATGLFLVFNRARAAGSSAARVWRVLPLLVPPLLVIMALATHKLVLPGWSPTGVAPFVFFWLGVLALPIVVGRALARDTLSEIETRLVLLAATIVACAMVAQLGGMVVSQLVASVLWPGGNWSFRLVSGLVVLILPTLLAVRSVSRGYGALRAARPI